MMVYVDKQLHTLKRQDCVKFPVLLFTLRRELLSLHLKIKPPAEK